MYHINRPEEKITQSYPKLLRDFLKKIYQNLDLKIKYTFMVIKIICKICICACVLSPNFSILYKRNFFFFFFCGM